MSRRERESERERASTNSAGRLQDRWRQQILMRRLGCQGELKVTSDEACVDATRKYLSSRASFEPSESLPGFTHVCHISFLGTRPVRLSLRKHSCNREVCVEKRERARELAQIRLADCKIGGVSRSSCQDCQGELKVTSDEACLDATRKYLSSRASFEPSENLPGVG